MKKEYDFTRGIRGKFSGPHVQLHYPIYLESDVADFIEKYARRKHTDAQSIVNEWLRKNIELGKSFR